MNKLLTQLSAILSRAVKKHGLAVNPVAGVERQPLKRSGDFNVLEPDEVALLAANAESPADAALFTVAALSGLRLGELRALVWQDVEFANRVIRVRRNYTSGEVNTPKSGKVRSVPLIDQAAVALDGLSRRGRFTAPDDLVFPSATGHWLDDAALRRRYYEALERAGLGKLRFHDLRHTFGTMAARVFPLHDVKAMMGHANIETTMIYLHSRPRHDDADRLSALVLADSVAEPRAVVES